MLRDMSATEGQGRARSRPVAAGAALSAALRGLVLLPCRGRAVVEFCFFSLDGKLSWGLTLSRALWPVDGRPP